MAAATGPALWPGTSTFPNTTVYPGQGSWPIVRLRLAFAPITDSAPVWTEVDINKMRSYSISRGRTSELSAFDAGTASVVLDNRDRAYDQAVNTNIRPMNRVWLYEEFSSEVQSLFRGYATAWDQEWPGGGSVDAITTLTAADEFLVLALDNLPATNPPSATYGDLIQYDSPEGYWPFGVNSFDQAVPEPPIEIPELEIPPSGFDVNPLPWKWRRWKKRPR